MTSNGASLRSARHLVAVVGPTASGKTAAAVEAAQRLEIEVVSADSRQVRAGMRIGTAAPTDAERTAVTHHLVEIVQPDQAFTLVDWLEAAREAIEAIWERGRLPLVVGGTGQYVWALLEGWAVPRVPPNPALREELERLAEREGAETLHRRLAAVDAASAARIDARNVRRVIRALEIVEATGEPVPPLKPRDPGFTWSTIGLHWPREELYRRIDDRTVGMFDQGLIEETRGLVERYGRTFRALRTIGYHEALDVIDGELSVEQAIERTQHATHRLVRMQANWFGMHDPRIEWVDGSDLDAAADAIVAAARRAVR
jgi:tRNA dimethylallyltransferase